MNDMADTITNNVVLAFKNVYTKLTSDDVKITFNDDETIDVELNHDDQSLWRAYVDSDDDGFLRFSPYDADYAEEFPDEDPCGFIMLRVKAY